MVCSCGDPIDPRRVALGYRTCPVCGDREARQVRFTVVPLNKGNYIPITNYIELKMLNPKSNQA